MVILSLSILMSNDNEIRKTCFYVFFSVVNIFTNDMIKTPFFFVSSYLNNIKIRNEFIERISIIKQKLIVILFWPSFFWYTWYIQMLILVRTAFFLEGIQTMQFHHKKKTNKHSKAGILMKLTQKSGNYCK